MDQSEYYKWQSMLHKAYLGDKSNPFTEYKMSQCHEEYLFQLAEKSRALSYWACVLSLISMSISLYVIFK